VIAKHVKGHLRRAGVTVTTGDSPELGRITDKVKQRINEVDAFIAIIHKRKDSQTSRWVDQEMGYAMGRNKPILLFVEKSLNLKGIEGELEYISFVNTRNAFNLDMERLREYVKQAAIRIQEQQLGQFLPDAVHRTAKSIDFAAAVAGCRREIVAVGIGMTLIVDTCDRDIFRRIRDNKNLKVTIVLSDPRANTSRMRAKDEGDQPNALCGDVAKIAIRYLGKAEMGNALSTGRLVFKFSKVYPTIAVAIFDTDLYAYFYGYQRRGTESPVLLFRNYPKNPSAQFFRQHADDIIRDAETIPLQELLRIQKSPKGAIV